MKKEEKGVVVSDLTDKFLGAKLIYFTNFSGLTGPEITLLRQRLREKGSIYQIAKNRLASLSLKKVGLDKFSTYLKGPNGFVFGNEDGAREATSILLQTSKEKPSFQIKIGFLRGCLLSEEEVRILAKLPEQKVLLGDLINKLNLPLARFVQALKGIEQNFLSVLSQIRK